VRLNCAALSAMMERQLETAAKMAMLGPTRATRSRLIAQYVLFLKLAQLKRGEMIVPTLGIDMVWHAHMNHPDDYEAFTLKVCGFFLDHSDDIPTQELEVQREATRKAWTAAFKQPYDPVLQVKLLPVGSMRPTAEDQRALGATTDTTTTGGGNGAAPVGDVTIAVTAASTCGGACMTIAPMAIVSSCGGIGGCGVKCGGGGTAACGGGTACGGVATCGGPTSTCGGGGCGGAMAASTCGGPTCGGGGGTTSACGGATTSACGGGGATASTCGGGGGTTSACGGGT